MENVKRSCAGLFTLFLLVGWTRPAGAHGILLESTPKSGETVTVGVSEVTLRFNSRIERALSRLQLTGPSGERLPLAVTRSETQGPAWLTAPVPTLLPGRYTVHWKVFTVDGRLSHGSFSFQVAERR